MHYKGEWRPTADVMKENGLSPIGIHVREGLSLTNGTSVMTGVSVVTRKAYDQVRGIVPVFVEDTPFHEDIAAVEAFLKSHRIAG